VLVTKTQIWGCPIVFAVSITTGSGTTVQLLAHVSGSATYPATAQALYQKCSMPGIALKRSHPPPIALTIVTILSALGEYDKLPLAVRVPGAV